MQVIFWPNVGQCSARNQKITTKTIMIKWSMFNRSFHLRNTPPLVNLHGWRWASGWRCNRSARCRRGSNWRRPSFPDAPQLHATALLNLRRIVVVVLSAKPTCFSLELRDALPSSPNFWFAGHWNNRTRTMRLLTTPEKEAPWDLNRTRSGWYHTAATPCHSQDFELPPALHINAPPRW